MSSQFLPLAPELPELPQIVDAQTKGLRLQGTLAKALPPMANVGSMTNVRQMEAEEFANDIRNAFAISRSYDKASRRIAKAKNKNTERYSKQYSKGTGYQGRSMSARQAARERASKYRAAGAYGYNPDQAMR
jgi:hypothetical protein